MARTNQQLTETYFDWSQRPKSSKFKWSSWAQKCSVCNDLHMQVFWIKRTWRMSCSLVLEDAEMIKTTQDLVASHKDTTPKRGRTFRKHVTQGHAYRIAFSRRTVQFVVGHITLAVPHLLKTASEKSPFSRSPFEFRAAPQLEQAGSRKNCWCHTDHSNPLKSTAAFLFQSSRNAFKASIGVLSLNKR